MSHGVGGNWICHAVKIYRAAMAIALTQTKDEMLIVHYPRRGHRLDLAREEKRLGISISKWLQHFVPAQKIYIDLRERQLMVQSHARLKSFFGKKFTRSFAKSFSKDVEILLVQRKTRRHFVPAEFVESLCTAAQRFDQIQPFNASSASFADSVLVEADHDGWSMIPSSDPRCYNAKYPRMPAGRSNHDGRVARRIEPILYLLLSLRRKFVFPPPGARDSAGRALLRALLPRRHRE